MALVSAAKKNVRCSWWSRLMHPSITWEFCTLLSELWDTTKLNWTFWHVYDPLYFTSKISKFSLKQSFSLLYENSSCVKKKVEMTIISLFSKCQWYYLGYIVMTKWLFLDGQNFQPHISSTEKLLRGKDCVRCTFLLFTFIHQENASRQIAKRTD